MAAPHFRGIHACGGSEVNLMMWGVAAIGFFSGIISGMGIGGGTILIPALLFLTGRESDLFYPDGSYGAHYAP